jgi:hypothetical protein
LEDLIAFTTGFEEDGINEGKRKAVRMGRRIAKREKEFSKNQGI